jgi:O-antigen/teichoic acid export membrane protein
VSDVAGSTDGLAVRLAANTFVQAVGSFISSLVAFFTFVAVTRGLGPEVFGQITAATAYLFIPTVLAEAGTSTAILREISADPGRTEPALRASVPLRVLVASCAVGGASALAFAIPFDHDTQIAILISSGGSFLTLMSLSLLPVLQSQLKMHWAVAGNVLGRVVTLGLTLAVLEAGYGLKSVVAAQVIGIGVTFLFHLVVVSRLVSLRPVLDTQYWRRLAGVSIVLGLAISLGQVYFRVDALLLALIRDPEEVGLYGAAYKFIELAEFIAASFALSVMPPMTRFIATGDARARSLLQKSFDLIIAVAAALAVALLVFSTDIVVAAAGPEFREGAVALQILAPYVLFSFTNALLWRVMIASGRDRILLGVSISILALNIVLNLVLIPTYGFKAAAATSVISEVAALIPVAVAARREGLLPGVGYLPAIAVAAGAMAVVALALPGPALAVGAAAGVTYAAVLLALPGTTRAFVFESLLPAARTRLGRSRA